MGNHPTGFELSIINNEIQELGDCSGSSITPITENFTCELEMVSCKFLKLLDEHGDDVILIKVCSAHVLLPNRNKSLLSPSHLKLF
jgi:hypothetical protein